MMSHHSQERVSLSVLSVCFGVGVVSSLAFLPGEAAACSYLESGLYGVTLPSPDDDVPVNHGVLVQIYTLNGPYETPGFRLFEEGSDEAIPLDISTLGGTQFLTLMVTPVGGFKPETTYEFQAYYDETESFPFSSSRFTTGSSQDLTAPESLSVLDVEAHYNSASGPRHPCPSGAESFLALEFEPEPGGIREIEVSATEDFGEAHSEFTPQTYVTLDLLTMGFDRGDELFVRVRPMDHAQNLGPWTEVEAVQIPLCAMAGDTPTGLASYLMMGFAMFLGGGRRRQAGERGAP